MEEKSTTKKLPKVYWISIFYEFIERGAYYGAMSILSVYLVASVANGGLGCSKMEAGILKATIQPIIYALPIICGAIADRFGYRKTLNVAFLLLGIGYISASQAKTYPLFFTSLIILSLGAGAFKPVINGTIARVTDSETSSIGFGIYYWSINLGAFLFLLIVVPLVRNSFRLNYVFLVSGIAILIMLIPNKFLYKEPPKPETSKDISQVFVDAVSVLKDYKFLILLFLYSGFWVIYFQMFDTILWYITEYVKLKPIENTINGLIPGFNGGFKFNPEYVTVINAGIIILLQLVVSNITKKTKALPTMITGISFGVIAMCLIGFSAYSAQIHATNDLSITTATLLSDEKYATNSSVIFHAWALVLGIILFTMGEMTAHPKFISYIGLIAPEEKVATYMGYSFLYGVIGSSIGCLIGPIAYNNFITKLDNPAGMWFLFAGIGLFTVISLTIYGKLVLKNKEKKEEK